MLQEIPSKMEKDWYKFLGFLPEISLFFLFLHRLRDSLILGSPHLVSSSCFWRSHRPVASHTSVSPTCVSPQGVLTTLLPKHSATGKKKFVRSRNSLREKKGNAECWLLGKGCAYAAAVVENAWEAPLTIALCYGLACVHTTKDQHSLKGSSYLHAVQHLAWVSSELPAEPHRTHVNNCCIGNFFQVWNSLSGERTGWQPASMMLFSRIWRHFGFYSTAWRTVGMRSPGMAGGLSRVESGPAHSRLFCATLKKSPVSCVEVSPWEKPVGLLWSRDRRELICMPQRQPVSRAWGKQRQPNWLCRQKVLSYPHRGLTQWDVNTEQAMQFFLAIACRIGSRSLAGHCHSHQSGGDSGTCFFSHHELLELCQMKTISVPWLCNF